MKEIETPIAPAEVHAVKGNGAKTKTNSHSSQATPKMLTKTVCIVAINMKPAKSSVQHIEKRASSIWKMTTFN